MLVLHYWKLNHVVDSFSSTILICISNYPVFVCFVFHLLGVPCPYVNSTSDCQSRPSLRMFRLFRCSLDVLSISFLWGKLSCNILTGSSLLVTSAPGTQLPSCTCPSLSFRDLLHLSFVGSPICCISCLLFSFAPSFCFFRMGMWKVNYFETGYFWKCLYSTLILHWQCDGV